MRSRNAFPLFDSPSPALNFNSTQWTCIINVANWLSKYYALIIFVSETVSQVIWRNWPHTNSICWIQYRGNVQHVCFNLHSYRNMTVRLSRLVYSHFDNSPTIYYIIYWYAKLCNQIRSFEGNLIALFHWVDHKSWSKCNYRLNGHEKHGHREREWKRKSAMNCVFKNDFVCGHGHNDAKTNQAETLQCGAVLVAGWPWPWKWTGARSKIGVTFCWFKEILPLH